MVNASQNVQYVDAHGSDPTGATDSTAAFQASVAALPTVTLNNGVVTKTYPVGTIRLGQGAYKIGTTQDISANLGPFVSIIGPGKTTCVVYYYGSVNAIRSYNEVTPNYLHGGWDQIFA